MYRCRRAVAGTITLSVATAVSPLLASTAQAKPWIDVMSGNIGLVCAQTAHHVAAAGATSHAAGLLTGSVPQVPLDVSPNLCGYW